MLRLLLAIIVLLFLSCNKNNKVDKDNDSDFFSLKESVHLPLSEIPTHQGHFVANDKDFFYTYNINTNNFFVYDKVKKLDSVNLKFASANQMVVKNLDSIFIIDYNDRLIKQLNFRNETVNTIDFYKLTNQDNLNPYLYNGQDLSINKQGIIITPSYVNNEKLDRKEYFYQSKSAPMFGIIADTNFIFSEYGFADFETLSSRNVNDIYIDYSNAIFSDKHVVFTMDFFNQLYVFDKELKFLKAVMIKSHYTGTDINNDYSFFNLKKGNQKRLIYGDNYDYATLTKHITFDKLNKLYYVLLIHKTDIANPSKLVEKRSNRPFSILVYNEEFELISEQKFKKNRHDFYQKNIYVSVKGELIINANNSMNTNYSKKHLQYNLYEIKTKH